MDAGGISCQSARIIRLNALPPAGDDSDDEDEVLFDDDEHGWPVELKTKAIRQKCGWPDNRRTIGATLVLALGGISFGPNVAPLATVPPLRPLRDTKATVVPAAAGATRPMDVISSLFGATSNSSWRAVLMAR